MKTDAAVTSNRAVIPTNADTIDTKGFGSTFPSTISGSGSLTKVGTSSLNLDGAQNYAMLKASAGTTHGNGTFTSGTATIITDATTNFSTS